MGQAVYADYHIGTLFAVLYMYPNCIVLTSLLLWGKGYAIHTHHISHVPAFRSTNRAWSE